MTEQPNTFVILWAQDHTLLENARTAALGDIPHLAAQLQAQGVDVRIIGNGRDILSLDEVQTRLQQIHGPATLMIAAHGGTPPLDGTAYLNIYGFNYGSHHSNGFMDRLTSNLEPEGEIHADALFSLIPPNFTTVIQQSCHAENALNYAYNYLPPGTVYLPLSNNEVGVGAISNGLVGRLTFNQRYTASDIYFQLLQSGHTPNRLGIGARTATPQELTAMTPEQRAGYEQGQQNIQANNINMPENIVVAGRAIIGVGNGVANAHGRQFTDEELDAYVPRIQNVLMQNYGPQIMNNLATPMYSHDVLNGREDRAMRSILRGILRPIADQITDGSMTPTHPDYAIALALSYEWGIDRGLIPATTPLVSTPTSSEQIMPGEHDNYTKVTTELRGILEGPDGQPQIPLEVLSQLRNPQTGVAFHSSGRTPENITQDAVTLTEILRANGISRIEQLGDHTPELEPAELNDFILRQARVATGPDGNSGRTRG